MGFKFEVATWVAAEPESLTNFDYGWEYVYGGDSLLRAILAAIASKRAGAGCVMLVWR
jgi:hypothetical protein